MLFKQTKIFLLNIWRLEMRVALKHYCRSGDKNLNKRKKESILDRRRRKIYPSLEQPESDDSGEKESKKKRMPSHLIGNTAVKKSRIIEIGWINYWVTDKSYHRVRAKNGGIPRKHDISKDATKSETLAIAKTKFFPGGKNKLGKLDDFECDLLDFSEEAVDDKETIAEMYQRLGIMRLKFNLATKYKFIEDDDNEQKNVSAKPLETTPLKTTQTFPMKNKSTKSFKTSETIHSALPTHKGKEPVYCSDCMNPRISPVVLCEDDSDPDITFMKFPGIVDNVDDQNETIPFKNEHNENVPCASGSCSLIYQAAFTAGIDTDQKNDNTEDTSKVVEDFPDIPPRSPTPPPTNDAPERSITIRRIMIESEMIAHFVDPTILDEKLQFKFIDERGVDVNGVSREAYTSFWVEFLETSAVGETERVPIVKASMQRAEWESVGRILAKGYIDHGVFPLKLSKVFTVALVHGESQISNSVLMNSFMNYIAVMEKDMVTKALSGCLVEEDDRDEFLDLLQRMGCRNIPSNEEVRASVLNVAYKELIHAPKYALDAMASTAKKNLQEKLPDVDSIIEMYEAAIPTCKKVIHLFRPQREGKEEERTLQFLKQYVKGLDHYMLKNFVRHVTGSDMLCVDKIEIHFNDRKGIARVPIVRTCTPMIELSTNYSSYIEMRAEFTALLKVHHPLDID